MPGQTAKPTLTGRFGAKAAAASAAASKAPVRYGPESLPPGIKNGIGRVTAVKLIEVKQDAKIKQLNGNSAAGQLQLQIDAAVAEPKSVAGPGGSQVGVTGRRMRSLFFPLFEGGASFWASHVPFSARAELDFNACVIEACNMMKVLAGPAFDTSNFDAAVAALDKLKPHFTFETVLKPAGGKNPSTGQPYPEQTQEFWGRGIKYDGKAAAGAGVQNDTGKAAVPPAQSAEPAASEPAFDETNAPDELGALADLADADPQAAGKAGTPEYAAAEKLTKAANDAGISDDELTGFPTWRSILDAMAERAGGAEGSDGAEAGEDAVEDEDDAVEEEEAKEWEKGDECVYVPPGKGKKPTACVISGLNKSKTKANVKTKDGKTKWENVPVDALTRPE